LLRKSESAAQTSALRSAHAFSSRTGQQQPRSEHCSEDVRFERAGTKPADLLTLAFAATICCLSRQKSLSEDQLQSGGPNLAERAH
jgi:hypothetical protein